ncbi:uncharacterized protein LOC118599910 [Oryzias melastigma]|uniref:uncharacterized protein LOC118599910 n=1 Tax=Oryzias melastigma TaxID=30732 RepID=UPI00168D5E65|nr:uncharacterized protein LOC118599910 [Oryzias melastigma]
MKTFNKQKPEKKRLVDRQGITHRKTFPTFCPGGKRIRFIREDRKTVKDSEEIFTQMIRLIQKRSCDVKQQIRSQQQTEVSRVKDLQEELEQEITELKRRDAELKQLSLTEDHNQFLLNYPSLPPLSESSHSSSINVRPLRYFEDVTAAVSELRDKLQDILREEWTNISRTLTHVDVLLPEPEPKRRADFFKSRSHSLSCSMLDCS